MGKFERLYDKIINDKSNNISFKDIQYFVEHLGFLRISTNGDHTIYKCEAVPEIINIQPDKSHNAKIYQVKQIRKIVLDYELRGDGDEK